MPWSNYFLEFDLSFVETWLQGKLKMHKSLIASYRIAISISCKIKLLSAHKNTRRRRRRRSTSQPQQATNNQTLQVDESAQEETLELPTLKAALSVQSLGYLGSKKEREPNVDEVENTCCY
ncbi:unnamed protein product [Malus baccata var. baccata]